MDFHDGPFQSVVLQVQLVSPCFPFSSWGPVPPGQNWPANCDAFDRNFEFSLDDPGPDGGRQASQPTGLQTAAGRPGFGGLAIGLPGFGSAGFSCGGA